MAVASKHSASNSPHPNKMHTVPAPSSAGRTGRVAARHQSTLPQNLPLVANLRWVQQPLISESGLASPSAVSRRLAGAALGTTTIGVGILAAAGVALAATVASRDPRSLVQSGMRKFRVNDVEGAAADFDAAWEAGPELRPYLWQRGLTHYYLGRYEEAAAQFRSDVAVNPNDTEEAIWAFLAEARIVGPEAARKQFLQVGKDPRPVMRAAYEAFQNGSGPEQIQAAISDNGGHSSFYGNLYIGLYHEAHGSLNEPAAKEALLAACATPYAITSGDYMASLARVHCKRRGWM